MFSTVSRINFHLAAFRRQQVTRGPPDYGSGRSGVFSLCDYRERSVLAYTITLASSILASWRQFVVVAN